MRFDSGFEHIDAERPVAVGFHFLAGRIDRRRHILHKGNNIAEELHHAADAHVLEGAHAEHREYGTVNEPLADTQTHLVLRQMLLLKELLHQRLVVFSRRLHELTMKLLGALALLFRNILDDGHTAIRAP